MFYTFARFLVAIYVRIFYRVKLVGRENVPSQGGAILCSNHTSMLDPLFLAVYIKRHVNYMAKKQLFKNPLLNRIFISLGAFPVDREGQDMVSYKKAINNLKDGKLLGIFIQGSRNAEIDLKSGRTGAAFFALKAGVPIIPVGISGRHRIFSRITVNYGSPVYLETYQDLKLKTEVLNEITEGVMEKIKLLTSEQSTLSSV